MKDGSTSLLDVLIVGGGPAGLAAALVLGRSLRRVLLCDAGHPRNECSQSLNGYLARDGIAPKEFLAFGRAELTRYETVEVRDVAASDLARTGDVFTATLASGAVATARFVLLAYGVTDKLPEIPGLAALYGKSVHSCPYCHGWECRSQPIAVLGGDSEAVELAHELLQWSADVILCANGALRCSRTARQKLEKSGIQVVEREIERLVAERDKLKGVSFADGTFLPRHSCFLMPEQEQHSTLGQRLGCKLTKTGCILCKDDGSTSVPGVFAAGNARQGTQLVIAAVAEGTVAAVALNERLLEVCPPKASVRCNQ